MDSSIFSAHTTRKELQFDREEMANEWNLTFRYEGYWIRVGRTNVIDLNKRTA